MIQKNRQLRDQGISSLINTDSRGGGQQLEGVHGFKATRNFRITNEKKKRQKAFHDEDT
jgi:hypothetical protein